MKSNVWLLRPMVLAVGSCFGISAWGNPLGPQVVQGSATFQGLGSNSLQVRNAPGTVINWQGFSIGQGQVTNFIQQNAASAVLNRVVGGDISQIHGTLSSNGRVFLINPAGIVVGSTGVIDTAGFVGSTLNMLDADFLAAKLRFTGDPSAGGITNQGTIRTSFGGSVVLIAPHIENGRDALIQTPGGELILAAGQKVTIGTLDANGVQFEVQAPSDSVVNLGKLIAQGGAVGVFAGTLKHSGDIRADALVRDEAGHVVLKAQSGAALAGGSISATGRKGGDITVLGDRITVSSGAIVDASGTRGGGRVRIGGDYQGANPALTNASETSVESGATLKADALESGDGGRIIVWSDLSTRFEGHLSARGGAQRGNGGFAEVSGKKNLYFGGSADLRAPGGTLGKLLLDPLDLFVRDAGGMLTFKDKNNNDAAFNPLASDAVTGNAVTVAPAALDNLKANVSLFAGRYMLIDGAINLTTPGASLTAEVAPYTPGALPGTPLNQLDINKSITTNGGAVSLKAPFIQSLASSTITTGGGAVTLQTTQAAVNLQGFGLNIDAGAGAVTATSLGGIQLGSIVGSGFTANPGTSISTGAITTTTPLALSATSVQTGVLTSNGKDVSITGTTSFVSTSGVTAGAGNVTLSGVSSVSGGTIDSSAAVKLTASAGSVSARVNNATSLEATSTTSSPFSSAFVSISSDTALNATNLTATATGCGSSFSCAGASVFVNAAGNINVGSIVAAAATSATNNKSASVNLTSTQGSILAASAASLVRATDVSLATGQNSGGGIGSAARALNADVERGFTLAPNGNFSVMLTGSGINRLTLQPGVAATGQSYSGTLARSGGGVSLSASATDATVTVSDLTVSGFDQAIFNSGPFISLNTPNGALVVNNMTVPPGDQTVPVPPATTPATQGLSVSVSASGDLTVTAYTRQGNAASLPKSTSFSSSFGNVTLGTVAANRDPVSISAGNNISISSLTTAGSVSASTFSGNIAVGQIDTTSGSGGVTLSGGKVGALNDTVALEVLSGSPINISATTIGEAAFANPLDVAAPSVALSSQNFGGQIGFAGKPVVANTSDLTINAVNSFTTTAGAAFNVSTGTSALTNLNVTATPAAVGSGGLAQVRTEAGQPNDRTYNFVSDGTNFSFAAGNVPSSQFAGGTLTFTTPRGNVALGDSNMGPTGALDLTASTGSITGNAVLDGQLLALSAGTGGAGSAVTLTTGNIGSSNTSAITLTAGVSGTASTQRTGSIQTGTLNSATSGAIDLTSTGGNIDIGPTGTADIGSAAARAGAVSMTSRTASSGSTTVSGRIRAGNIFSSSVEKIQSVFNDVITGNIDATGGISLVSRANVTTGALDADKITIANDAGNLLGKEPTITIGTVGAVKAPTLLDLFGEASTVGGNGVTLTGPVTLAPASTMAIKMARSGAVTLGGAIVGGAGSDISIGQFGTGPLQFSTINAGAGGSVGLGSAFGIQQTVAAGAGGGITADNVALGPGTGPINNSADPSGRVDLNGVKALTVSGSGAVALDAHGSTLNSINVTRDATVAAAPFELANLGSGQVVTMSSAPSDMTLVATSPSSPLAVTIVNNVGGIALGAGMVTSGGSVNLTANGPIDVTSGIVTGGADGGGAVTLRTSPSSTTSSGNILTGAIDTTPSGTGTGGAITLTTGSNAQGDIVLGGDLRTGPGGSAINLMIDTRGNVTRSGSASVASEASVGITTANGSIGTAGAPLLITTPIATLSAASGTVAGSGVVFATLSGTTNLNLTAHNGFNVVSNDAFDTLSLSTRGSGTGTPGAGTLNLAAGGGQAYAFDRPSTDAFGAAITNTFQLISGGGTAAPSTATFNAIDGTLLVVGGASLSSPTLNLGIPSGSNSDIVLQGTAASPLALSNTTQKFAAPRDLVITGSVTLNATSQTLSAARDITATGKIALTGTDQNFTAQRNFTAQAAGGSLTITGGKQKIGATDGAVSFIGGDNADETLTVTASEKQRLYTPFNTGTDLLIKGGQGDRSNVLVTFTGTDGAADSEFNSSTEGQILQARGNVIVQGGAGVNSEALVTTGTASQLVRAGSRFEPSDLTRGNIRVLGGSNTGAKARITNTGTGNQQIGESRTSSSFPRIDFDFQSRDIEIRAGSATGAGAEVLATGAQQLYSRGGTMTVAGGATGATARVESTSATAQQIGLPNTLAGNRMGALTVQGGAGTGATALVNSPNAQIFTMSGTLTVMGGGPGSTAAVTGATQSLSIGGLNVQGGTGDNATALLQAVTGSQAFGSMGAAAIVGGAGAGSTARVNAADSQTTSFFSTFDVTGGTGSGAFARFDSAMTQTLNGSLLRVTAQGTTAAPAANASAIVEAPSQTINSSVQVTGGVGAAGAPSDAIVRTLTGDQKIDGSTIAVTSGTRNSTAMIVNAGTGTQMLDAFSGISLTGLAAAEASAPALIQNTPATAQSVCSFFGSGACSGVTGPVNLTNNGAGLVAVTSAGNQFFNTRSIGVSTTAGSAGNSLIRSEGTQWIHTSNLSSTTPSMRVAALGTGKASVETPSTQLLEVDYPDVMAPGATRLANLIIGDPAAAGTSLIQAVDQAIFAGSVAVQSGPGAGSAKLLASGTQTISTVTGGITMATTGPDTGAASASIDPAFQSIVTSGAGSMTGNGGPTSILSGGPQTLLVMNGPFTMSGSSPASQATVNTSAPGSQQTVLAQGGFTLNPNASIGAGPETGSGAATTAAGGSAGQLVRTQDELDLVLSETDISDAQAGRRRGNIGSCQ